MVIYIDFLRVWNFEWKMKLAVYWYKIVITDKHWTLFHDDESTKHNDW
jgi:hypothetical protein